MQYDVKTPEEYFKALEDDWRREKLLALRRIILSRAPELTEGIDYKMLSYGDDRGTVFHLNAQKNFVALYVGNAHKIDTDGSLLRGLDVGKGCIRIQKSVALAQTRLDEFVGRAVEMWKQGKDIDC